MKKFVSIFLSAVIICGLLLISACDRTEDVRKSDGKISVVTTIFPYYDFVRQLAGDKVDIRLLLSPGSDPHSYEPKPSDITAIENCDIFICNGGESDEWVDGVLSSIENKDVKVMKMMEYVPLRHEQSMDHDHEHDSHEDMDDDEGHDHEEGEEYDEHVWTSIRNAERMSASIADECQLTAKILNITMTEKQITFHSLTALIRNLPKLQITKSVIRLFLATDFRFCIL